MSELSDTGMWLIDSGEEGANLCICTAVHGDERLPVEAATQLASMFSTDELGITEGKLLLIIANPPSVAEGRRWTERGIDLDRCFCQAPPAGAARSYETGRAREITRLLDLADVEILVDFRSASEPAGRFLVQQAAKTCPRHREVSELLEPEVLVTDPNRLLTEGTLCGWMTARRCVAVRCEVGSGEAPDTSPLIVRDQMINLMAGLGMILGRAYRKHPDRVYLRIAERLTLTGAGFTWNPGVGDDLRLLPAGTVLGAYADGGEVTLDAAATLICPERDTDRLVAGEPLVLLAR